MAKKICPDSIRYRLVTDFTKESITDHLITWSDAIRSNSQHMKPETPESLRNNLIFAVLAFHNGILVGAGGIMYPPEKKLFYNKRKVVEFRSVYHDPNYKKCGIATGLVLRRLKFVKDKKFFPITLTQQPDMEPILRKTGWVLIEELFSKKLVPIKNGLRACDCHSNKRLPFVGDRCSVCPMRNRFIWIHPESL